MTLLRNRASGVVVDVDDAKAKNMVASGTYEAVKKTTRRKTKPAAPAEANSADEATT